LIYKKKSFYEIISFEGNERDRSPLLPYLFNSYLFSPFGLLLASVSKGIEGTFKEVV